MIFLKAGQLLSGPVSSVIQISRILSAVYIKVHPRDRVLRFLLKSVQNISYEINRERLSHLPLIPNLSRTQYTILYKIFSGLCLLSAFAI